MTSPGVLYRCEQKTPVPASAKLEMTYIRDTAGHHHLEGQASPSRSSSGLHQISRHESGVSLPRFRRVSRGLR
jgi:hypothetical protein